MSEDWLDELVEERQYPGVFSDTTGVFSGRLKTSVKEPAL